MVEYIDQNIQTIAWQTTGTKCSSDNLIAGSNIAISIWQFHDRLGSLDQLPIVECSREMISSPAVRVRMLGNRAYSALSNGTVLVHEVATDKTGPKSLNILAEPKDLHKSYRCNDMLFCPQLNSVITCGNDGGLAIFNVDRPKTVDYNVYSDASLKCMDLMSPSEVICGTMHGCLRHYDIRTKNCVGSYSNHSFSTLLCVQRNPHVNHLAIGGNDQGSIIIYDLRNNSAALAEISAHTSAVTNIKYRPNDPNTIYSSSVDGDLFQWSLNTQFVVSHVPKQVESIASLGDVISIASFDVNDAGEIVYTTDHGAIFYRSKS